MWAYCLTDGSHVVWSGSGYASRNDAVKAGLNALRTAMQTARSMTIDVFQGSK